MKKVEVYVSIHSIVNSIVTVTSSPEYRNFIELPLSECDRFEFHPTNPKRTMIRIPEYLAMGKGLYQQQGGGAEVESGVTRSLEQELRDQFLANTPKVSGDRTPLTRVPESRLESRLPKKTTAGERLMLQNAVKIHADRFREDSADE